MIPVCGLPAPPTETLLLRTVAAGSVFSPTPAVPPTVVTLIVALLSVSAEFREEVRNGFMEAQENPGRPHGLSSALTEGEPPAGPIDGFAFGWEAGQEAWKHLHRP